MNKQTDNKQYIKPLDIYINSKVIFTDPLTDQDTIIKLFDEYQIKWFNQLTGDELYEYFQEVISFYKEEEEFLCQSSSVIELQRKFSTGYNYGIIQRDDYSMRNDEDDEDDNNMWITQGWKNNYGGAVYKELERVISDWEQKVKRVA